VAVYASYNRERESFKERYDDTSRRVVPVDVPVFHGKHLRKTRYMELATMQLLAQ